MDDLKQRILSIIKQPGLAALATVAEDGNPWVRYVIAIGSDDMSIRLATFVVARKVKHIAKNPNVHLACGVPNAEHHTNYLQVQGRAKVTTDMAEKKAFWNDELKKIFKGPDDPNYGVIIIKPERIELWSSMMGPEVWQA